MSVRVLVVEDEKDIADLIGLHLKREGHAVTTVENGEEAIGLLSNAATEPFDLLILDWMLPGLSGLELCKKIRSESQGSSVPILMVTARAHTSDIVLGLEVGADDYLTKPFELPVFLARVRALLRRSTPASEADAKEFRLGDLSLDLNTYRVTCGKKELQLTPSEFKLLVALVKSQGRVLTREKLIDLVQGEGVSVVDRAIDTHVFGLRKKLGKCAEVVETIRGVGYRVRI
jgi:two-component system, OmpR family, phosphate regulon response regulator PhoB